MFMGFLGNAISLSIGQQADESFNLFRVKHQREYQQGTAEYDMRRELFYQRFEAIQAHNEKEGMLWKEAISHFSDQTDAERQALLGYVGASRGLSKQGRGASMLQVSNASRAVLPESKDWMHLKTAALAKDQGQCGSCWAVSTASTLEAHYEIYSAPANGGKTRSFSAQQIIECTPNPNACGGTGGCHGATCELAMQYIKEKGLATNEEVPYRGSDGACSAASSDNDDSLSELSPAAHGGAEFGFLDYTTLETNKDYPLAQAVANYGPVAITAGASGWFGYSSGIFHGCRKDVVINHAITLFGYGKDPKLNNAKYWLIRNSWGSGWGENGFIRMLRVEDNADGSKRADCGTDHNPQEGITCKGGPKTVEVCGMCGMLYDSTLPYFKGSPGHESFAQSSDSAVSIDGLAGLMRAKRH
jgi:cathepsin L